MAFIYGDYGYAKDSSNNYIMNRGHYVYQIRLGYELQSQDIENNTSSVKLQLEVRSVDSAYKTYGYNQTTTIDGTALSSKTFDFRSTNTWQIFGTTTKTITHNADGTYSASKEGSFTTNATGTGRPHSGSASVQVSLPTIPRASQITVNDANIGSSTNIVINKASDSFTTSLYYKAFDENSWTQIVSKTSNQVYGWTVPTSFYNKIPSSKTMTCQFLAQTYNGDTLVGSSTTSATFTATGSPIINWISADDINSTTLALTDDNSKIVRYASNVQAVVNTSPQNSASIVSVTINGIDATHTSGSMVYGDYTFYNCSTNSFNVIVTDSRGYSTSQTVTRTIIDYVPLTANAQITRNTPIDGKVNISFGGSYWTGNFGNSSNSLYVYYRYKESTSNTWGSWIDISSDATISGTSYSGTKQISNIDYTKQYDFEIRASDLITERTITGLRISTGQPVFWWNENSFHITTDARVDGYLSNDILNNYYGKGFDNVDADDFTQNGVYYLRTGCTNIPVSAYFYLIVVRACYSGTSDMIQFGFDYNCNMYIRFRNGTTWGNWVQK